MTPIESELMAIIALIRDAIRQGLKTEEILERLTSPSSVARDMLDRATARRDAAEAYLGRDPSAVLVEAEEPAQPRRRRRTRAE